MSDKQDFGNLMAQDSDSEALTLLMFRINSLIKERDEMKEQLQEANEYADRLVEHKDMVCLPADLANLREANAHFAIENEALKKEIKDLRDLLMFGK